MSVEVEQGQEDPEEQRHHFHGHLLKFPRETKGEEDLQDKHHRPRCPWKWNKAKKTLKNNATTSTDIFSSSHGKQKEKKTSRTNIIVQDVRGSGTRPRRP